MNLIHGAFLFCLLKKPSLFYFQPFPYSLLFHCAQQILGIYKWQDCTYEKTKNLFEVKSLQIDDKPSTITIKKPAESLKVAWIPFTMFIEVLIYLDEWTSLKHQNSNTWKWFLIYDWWTLYSSISFETMLYSTFILIVCYFRCFVG